MNKIIDSFFLVCVKQREPIITFFKLLYIGISLLTVIASVYVYLRLPHYAGFLSLAGEMGEYSIAVYILTIIPGIFRRFRKNHKLVSLLMIYRRYIGILLFFMILYHYMMERGIDLLRTWNPFLNLMVFEISGMIAFFCILLLTVTSNDLSTHKLGIWWGRIHGLTYAIIWFMFLHVAMQEINIWSLLLGTAGVVQVLSFIYMYRKSSRVSSS